MPRSRNPGGAPHLIWRDALRTHSREPCTYARLGLDYEAGRDSASLRPISTLLLASPGNVSR